MIKPLDHTIFEWNIKIIKYKNIKWNNIRDEYYYKKQKYLSILLK